MESEPSSSAVDVVWLSDPEQPPILMFEVESTAAASLSNNAMKILGKESSVLKNRFFLHIVVKGGEKSSRVSLAEKTFYAHNYRIYLLGKGDALILLSDVFNQHRRVHSQLDLTHLIADQSN